MFPIPERCIDWKKVFMVEPRTNYKGWSIAGSWYACRNGIYISGIATLNELKRIIDLRCIGDVFTYDGSKNPWYIEPGSPEAAHVLATNLWELFFMLGTVPCKPGPGQPAPLI